MGSMNDASSGTRWAAKALVQWMTVEAVIVPLGVETAHVVRGASPSTVEEMLDLLMLVAGQCVNRVAPASISLVSSHWANLAGWLDPAGHS